MTKLNRRAALVAALSMLALTGCVSSPTVERATPEPITTGVGVVKADPYEALYAKKGYAYRKVAAHSHYHSPIIKGERLHGHSRIWGDASLKVQRASIEAIRTAAAKASMTLEQEAMTLAIAYIESGFNPDAAAGTTSAQGIGQFIRSTGSHYGLTDENRWDVEIQAEALVRHTLDNYSAAKRTGLGEEYVYARHHDGSFTNKYGGVDLSIMKVMPKYRQILKLLAKS